eukprot:TRINITY_DN10217_c0_g2_i2.p1 TRINITY_DN10217_c0_g2~~TRINITY_DN10217_c0_g2_i2.p1  ORF type:complete len:1723 (+),score=329.83 TRINITY_DN10217_c0_g2_i2:66-5234(+)
MAGSDRLPFPQIVSAVTPPALHYAVEHDTVAAVRQIMARDAASVMQEDESGRTALHVAALLGKRDVTEILLDAGANISHPDHRRWTPLIVAAFANQLEIVDLLIQRGADINAEDTNRGTALHWACAKDADRIVGRLLDSGAVVNCEDNIHATPLHYCANMGSLRSAELLLKRHANIHAVDLAEMSVLHQAVSQGEVGMVELLCSNGAIPDVYDSEGVSPLLLAIRARNAEIVEVLCRFKADANIADHVHGRTPLHEACVLGHVTILASVLRTNASLNRRDLSGRTALHYAVTGDDKKEVCALLLTQDDTSSVDVNAGDCNLTRPIHFAAYYHANKCLKLLLRAGASVTTVDCAGRSALHWAALSGNMIATRELLMLGVLVNAIDKRRRTALDLAIDASHHELVEYLRSCNGQRGWVLDRNAAIDLQKLVDRRRAAQRSMWTVPAAAVVLQRCWRRAHIRKTVQKSTPLLVPVPVVEQSSTTSSRRPSTELVIMPRVERLQSLRQMRSSIQLDLELTEAQLQLLREQDALRSRSESLQELLLAARSKLAECQSQEALLVQSLQREHADIGGVAQSEQGLQLEEVRARMHLCDLELAKYQAEQQEVDVKLAALRERPTPLATNSSPDLIELTTRTLQATSQSAAPSARREALHSVSSFRERLRLQMASTTRTLVAETKSAQEDLGRELDQASKRPPSMQALRSLRRSVAFSQSPLRSEITRVQDEIAVLEEFLRHNTEAVQRAAALRGQVATDSSVAAAVAQLGQSDDSVADLSDAVLQAQKAIWLERELPSEAMQEDAARTWQIVLTLLEGQRSSDNAYFVQLDKVLTKIFSSRQEGAGLKEVDVTASVLQRKRLRLQQMQQLDLEYNQRESVHQVQLLAAASPSGAVSDTETETEDSQFDVTPRDRTSTEIRETLSAKVTATVAKAVTRGFEKFPTMGVILPGTTKKLRLDVTVTSEKISFFQSRLFGRGTVLLERPLTTTMTLQKLMDHPRGINVIDKRETIFCTSKRRDIFIALTEHFIQALREKSLPARVPRLAPRSLSVAAGQAPRPAPRSYSVAAGKAPVEIAPVSPSGSLLQSVRPTTSPIALPVVPAPPTIARLASFVKEESEAVRTPTTPTQIAAALSIPYSSPASLPASPSPPSTASPSRSDNLHIDVVTAPTVIHTEADFPPESRAPELPAAEDNTTQTTSASAPTTPLAERRRGSAVSLSSMDVMPPSSARLSLRRRSSMDSLSSNGAKKSQRLPSPRDESETSPFVQSQLDAMKRFVERSADESNDLKRQLGEMQIQLQQVLQQTSPQALPAPAPNQDDNAVQHALDADLLALNVRALPTGKSAKLLAVLLATSANVDVTTKSDRTTVFRCDTSSVTIDVDSTSPTGLWLRRDNEVLYCTCKQRRLLCDVISRMQLERPSAVASSFEPGLVTDLPAVPTLDFVVAGASVASRDSIDSTTSLSTISQHAADADVSASVAADAIIEHQGTQTDGTSDDGDKEVDVLERSEVEVQTDISHESSAHAPANSVASLPPVSVEQAYSDALAVHNLLSALNAAASVAKRAVIDPTPVIITPRSISTSPPAPMLELHTDHSDLLHTDRSNMLHFERADDVLAMPSPRSQLISPRSTTSSQSVSSASPKQPPSSYGRLSMTNIIRQRQDATPSSPSGSMAVRNALRRGVPPLRTTPEDTHKSRTPHGDQPRPSDLMYAYAAWGLASPRILRSNTERRDK